MEQRENNILPGEGSRIYFTLKSFIFYSYEENTKKALVTIPARRVERTDGGRRHRPKLVGCRDPSYHGLVTWEAFVADDGGWGRQCNQFSAFT